jgi:2-C-methyl-D-erythritol 4-phosphate cytidylyltransferase
VGINNLVSTACYLEAELEEGCRLKDFGTAVILCGGKSTRMGFDKCMIKVKNKYLIEIIGEKLELIFENIFLATNDLEKIKGLNCYRLRYACHRPGLYKAYGGNNKES